MYYGNVGKCASRENIATPMAGSSSNVFTWDGDSNGGGGGGTRGVDLGEICHPVHGTIPCRTRTAFVYHHCHPSPKIKLISHMSARSVPFTYAFDSVV